MRGRIATDGAWRSELRELDDAILASSQCSNARLGWNRVGVVSRYALFPDGRFYDMTVFRKELSRV